MKTAKLSVLPIKDLNPAEYNPRKRLKPGDKEYEKIKLDRLQLTGQIF